MTISKTIEWIAKSPDKLVPGLVKLIDQTKLPCELSFIETDDLETIWNAIKTLQVRGAPAIGVAAAMGVAASAQNIDSDKTLDIISEVMRASDYLATSRPTAVNLFWALERMKKTASDNSTLTAPKLKELLAKEANLVRDEDANMCRAIGKHGAELLNDGDTVLTHCNAGGLATSEYGTALAPIYTAVESGKEIKVFSDETRPLLQGSRLTVWELMQAGIDVTLICDNTAAQVMKEGRIDAIMVGSDRIAANGDAANKIGTYSVAVLAKAHNIPFYILAPSSTVDLNTPSGKEIVIEERGPEEIINGFGKPTAPENAKVYSPAFDVTPAELITAIICEKGIIKPPFESNLAQAATN